MASRKGDAEIKEGNCLPLKLIPLGTFVHNVEMKPGKGGQMARSAGNYAQVVAKEGDYGHLRLPSGEVKLMHLALHRDDRSGRQYRPREHRLGQGRKVEMARRQTHRSWCCNEPGRPSPRWR